MNTTDRRKSYTPDQIEAERQYTIRYREQNRERLSQTAAERRAAGKCKPTSYYRKNASEDQKAAELVQKKKHYQETKQHQLAYAAKYRQDNSDRLKALSIGRYEKRKKYFDQYNLVNKDRIAERRAKWTKANIDRIKFMNAEWVKANSDRHCAHQHARRARKKLSGGVLSFDLVPSLLILQRGLCACCGKKLAKKYEIDHIIPISKGGDNTDKNIQILTPRCNRQKGSADPIQFMQRRGRLL